MYTSTYNFLLEGKKVLPNFSVRNQASVASPFNNMQTLKFKIQFSHGLHFLLLSITEASEKEEVGLNRFKRSCSCAVIGGF